MTDDNVITKADFEDLARQHHRSLKSFLYRFITSKHEAEDIAQETLLKAFQKFDTFKGKSSFKTWLFSIGANLAKDHLRSKKRWTVNAQDNCKTLIGSTQNLATELRHINTHRSMGNMKFTNTLIFASPVFPRHC